MVKMSLDGRPGRRGPMLRVIYAGVGMAFLALCAHLAYGTAYHISKLGSASVQRFADGFESGDLSAWKSDDRELCCDHSATVVAQGAREGDRALSFKLQADDPRVAGSKRSELRLDAVSLGDERWYAFSVKVPDDWPTTAELVTVAQWHAVDDRILGEGGRAPPLRLILNGESWAIAVHWDDRLLSGFPYMKASARDGAVLWTGPLRRGTWIDWVFRVRWSYEQDGLIEIWKDGHAIARREGPNAYNDLMGPFFKVGIYIPQWKGSAVGRDAIRELIFDRIIQDTRPIPPDGRQSITALTGN